MIIVYKAFGDYKRTEIKVDSLWDDSKSNDAVKYLESLSAEMEKLNDRIKQKGFDYGFACWVEKMEVNN